MSSQQNVEFPHPAVAGRGEPDLLLRQRQERIVPSAIVISLEEKNHIK
jgi:hypothetical protein